MAPVLLLELLLKQSHLLLGGKGLLGSRHLRVERCLARSGLLGLRGRDGARGKVRWKVLNGPTLPPRTAPVTNLSP